MCARLWWLVLLTPVCGSGAHLLLHFLVLLVLPGAVAERGQTLSTDSCSSVGLLHRLPGAAAQKVSWHVLAWA